MFFQAFNKDGAAKITKDLCPHGLLQESVDFLSPSEAGGINGGIEEGKRINKFLNFVKVYITPGEEMALDDDEIQDIINRSRLDEEFIINQ